MHAIVTYLFAQEPQWSIFLSTVGYLAAAWVIGTILRRPMSEGLALGLLILIAAGDLALYLFRFTGWSLTGFLPVSLGLLAAIVMAVRHFPLAPSATLALPVRQKILVAVVVAGLWAVFWVVRIITPDPAAGYMIFQALNPLYLDLCFETGRMLKDTDLTIGPGEITAALHYPADTLGLAALAKGLTGVGGHPAYAATSIAATLAALAALTGALGRRPFAVLTFAFMTLLFLKFGSGYRTVLGNNWGDITLYLSGALALTYMARGGSFRHALPSIVLAFSFMVFARNFGAFYATVAGAICLVVFVRFHGVKRWGGWAALVGLGVVFSLKELIQAATLGPYYPRHYLTVQAPAALEFHLQGTAFDWGMLPHPMVLDLPIPAIVFTALAGLLLWRRKNDRPWRLARFLAVGGPWLLLIAPLALEIVTGYRQMQAFSKIYIGAVFVLSWLPAYLVFRSDIDAVWRRMRRSVRNGAAVAVGVAVVVMAVVAGLWASQRPIGRMGLEAYLQNALERYRDDNNDMRIASRLLAELPPSMTRDRPVVFFYTEPGMGLRYFLGGSLQSDFDFWSDPVQSKMETTDSLAEALVSLGSPNLYFGYPSFKEKGRQGGYMAWKKFEPDIDAITRQPWVVKTIVYRESVFIVTDPKALAETAATTRAAKP